MERRRLRIENGTEVPVLLSERPRATGASGEAPRPRCLLLHGNPGSLADFEPLIPRLSADVDLAAIDLPGFGDSARPSTIDAFSLERLAAHVVEVADTLGWRERFAIVGHSHGGGVAQVAAALYPDRISALILVGTLGTPAHQSYRLLALPGALSCAWLAGRLVRSTALRPLSRLIVKSVLVDIFSPDPVDPERLEREVEQFARRPEILTSMVRVVRGQPCERLANTAALIRCPTLFLHGDEDVLVPPVHARNLHERILGSGGRSEFQLVKDAGHLMIGSRASEIAGRIQAFLTPPPEISGGVENDARLF